MDTEAKLDLLANVDDFVFGHVLRAGETRARATEASGTSHAEVIAAFITEQLRSGQFPHLARLAEDPAAQTMIESGKIGDRFETGLRALIDGAVRAVPSGRDRQRQAEAPSGVGPPVPHDQAGRG